MALNVLALLIWIGREDTNLHAPILLSLAFMLLAVLLQTKQRLSGKTFSTSAALIILGLAGGIVGIGTTFCAALIMLLKTGWHAHVFPDFPFGLILDVLRLSLSWAGAGVLTGIGIGLFWMAVRKAPAGESWDEISQRSD